jgi:polyhydroxyalkanoate synthesis regulator phasin
LHCHFATARKLAGIIFLFVAKHGLSALNIGFGVDSHAVALRISANWQWCARFLNACSRIHSYSLTFLSLIKMEDLFKKFVYTGVGMVSTTLEKFQKSVEKLVDEDKLSQEEGKKLVDDLFKNTESKREEFETKLKKVVEEVMVRMNLATQTQIHELQDRLAVIETKLGIEVPEKKEDSKSKKKAPAKKAAEAVAAEA